MKKKSVFFAALLMLAACSSDNMEEQKSKVNLQSVIMTFSPYTMESMTRTVTSIAGIVTHLDVWLYENGNEVTAIHQSSGDIGFGSVAVTLDKTKTYTLYAVAHKCTDNATLTNGIIAFPDDKVTHSMFYTTTFSPFTTTSLSCEMQRIVAQFRLETTDEVPSVCKKVQFTIGNVFDRWHVQNGGTHSIDKQHTVNITSTASDGTVAINIFSITTDAQTLHDISVDALDKDDNVVQSRTFANVPLRNGYKTTYHGAFFTDTTMEMMFTIDDWNEYDTIEF